MKDNVYPQLHLDNQLCFSVYSLSRLITQAYQPLLKKLKLTYPQYLVMLVLWQAQEEGRSPVSVKYLCGRLLLDTGTVTPLLKRMEASALLHRRRSSLDERVVLVELTPDGWALRQQAAEIPQDLLCAAGVEMAEALSLKERLQSLISRWRCRSSC